MSKRNTQKKVLRTEKKDAKSIAIKTFAIMMCVMMVVSIISGLTSGFMASGL